MIPTIVQQIIQFLLGLVGMGLSQAESAKIIEENKQLDDALDRATKTSDTSDLDRLTK